MGKNLDYFKIIHQWLRIKFSLSKVEFNIQNLYFEDIPLKEVLSRRGLFLLLAAVKGAKYDSISLNHGIKRVLISSKDVPEFSGVIWDYRPKGNATELSNKFTQILEDNFLEIQREYQKVKKLKVKFPDSDSLTNEAGLWSFLPFFTKNGEPISELHEECPVLSQILLSSPINVTYGFCSFSILSPNTKIAPHRGSTSLRYRYHLGLEIPEPDKCKIRVGDQWINWEEGRSFSFDDSFDHEVIHSGEKERGILIIDLWPERIPANVVSYLEGNSIFKNFGVLAHDSKILLKD